MISRKVMISVMLMLFFASSVLGAKMIQNEGQLLAGFNDKKFIQDIRLNETKINDAYILQNGVVYVPLKKIVLALQQEYQYSKKDNWVIVTTADEKFKLLLNSSQYYIGKEVHNYKTNENLNEVKPIFAKGRIYAPLQFVEEIFSVKQVGKTLYIENKAKSLELDTEIKKEIKIEEETLSGTDETEQSLENTANKMDNSDINEKRTLGSTYQSNKSKPQNTTKRKKKKRRSTSNQSNSTLQEQQNLIDEDQTDNINQSENDNQNNDENVSGNESEAVNETNSGSNETNEGLNEEPTESAPEEQANPTPSEPVSELN